jgi:hypothetical protein
MMWRFARRIPRSRRDLLAALVLLAAPPGFAQMAPSAGSISDQVARMKPGDFFWAPEVAPKGPMLIVVSLEAQRAYVYRNGVPIGVSTVSTGKKGHRTPTGVFVILQKRVEHHSNRYGNAPMPYMQRLTWSGVAMHAGNLPGYPASHGCIRLPAAFAKLLYAATSLGLTVVITDQAAAPTVAPSPALLAAGTVAPEIASPTETLWRPERAPQGPLSIVVSAADKRLIVLRNGVLIGSAPIGIEGSIATPSAYTLEAVDDRGAHWLKLPLPGQSTAPPARSAAEARLQMPEAFRRSLTTLLAPGATVVVAADSLRSAGAGKPLTVMTGEDR